MNERAIRVDIDANEAYLVPIGDVHLGDHAFTKESERKLKGYIEWIRKTPNAVSIIMGDIFNTATRQSKTSPFDSISLRDEIRNAIRLFEPIKDKIIGVIDGNHEARAEDYMGYSPLIHFCDVLGLRYLRYSGVFKINVGFIKRNVYPGPTARISYIIYAHHTTGGGTTKGGRLNRVVKLSDIIINADIYLGAHNHDLIASPSERFVVDRRSGKVSRIRQVFVDCGSYLDWNNSYAEKKMYPPLKIGSPKIRLDGMKRDIHETL